MVCKCNICLNCFKNGYEIAIDSTESLLSTTAFLSLFYKKPEFSPKNKELFQSHIDFLILLVKILFLLLKKEQNFY